MEQSSSYNAYMISIHALLAESDAVTTVVVGPSSDFYPRSPCGERPAADLLAIDTGAFLSTLSLRRATKDQGRQPADPGISIHALLAESDPAKLPKQIRERISIHALLAESDTVNIQRPTAKNDFYPRSPCGERPEAINPS